MLGDDCLDDRENPYAKWVANNVLGEDGQPVDDITQVAREARIGVDGVKEEFRISTSLKSRHRKLHHGDPTFDVESSHENGSSSSGGDDTDHVDNENDENQNGDSGLPWFYLQKKNILHMSLKIKIMTYKQSRIFLFTHPHGEEDKMRVHH